MKLPTYRFNGVNIQPAQQTKKQAKLGSKATMVLGTWLTLWCTNHCHAPSRNRSENSWQLRWSSVIRHDFGSLRLEPSVPTYVPDVNQPIRLAGEDGQTDIQKKRKTFIKGQSQRKNMDVSMEVNQWKYHCHSHPSYHCYQNHLHDSFYSCYHYSYLIVAIIFVVAVVVVSLSRLYPSFSQFTRNKF